MQSTDADQSADRSTVTDPQLCEFQFPEPRMDDLCILDDDHFGPHVSQHGWNFEAYR